MNFAEKLEKYNYIKIIEGCIYKKGEILRITKKLKGDDYDFYTTGMSWTNCVEKQIYIFVTDKYAEKHKP